MTCPCNGILSVAALQQSGLGYRAGQHVIITYYNWSLEVSTKQTGMAVILSAAGSCKGCLGVARWRQLPVHL